jgi:hypothetical protein
MRAHGVSDFPDPNSSGGIQIQSGPGGPGSSELDPSNPQFQSAQQACKSLQPSKGTPAQQADRKAGALKFSKCMRSHGLVDFPDPNSSGATQIQGGPGGDLNPNDPRFQAAQTACQHLLPGGGKGLRTAVGNGGSGTGSGTVGK